MIILKMNRLTKWRAMQKDEENGMTVPMNLKQILRNPKFFLRIRNNQWEICTSNHCITNGVLDVSSIVLASGDNLEECNANFTKLEKSQNGCKKD